MKLDETTKAHARKVLDRLNTLRSQRDFVAHSQWTPTMDDKLRNEEEARAVFKSWKNLKPYDHEVVSREKLRRMFRKIEVLYWDLLFFPRPFGEPFISSLRT